MKKRTPRAGLAVVGAFGLLLSGCATDRQMFAGHVADGAAPIVKGYRDCVQKDSTLNDNEKRMRLSLADEFVNYVEGGKK